jgi:lipid-binding SYLF domain-containing protein
MRYALLSVLAVMAVTLAGCETNTPQSAANRTDLQNRGQSTLQQMTANDAKLADVVNSSYAYAIFPEVGKAAVGVGGASGDGIVYQNGQMVGTVKLDQASIGLQAGGETYSELLVFKDQDAFNRLVNGNLTFGAQSSAMIIKAGAAGAAPFEKGVAVYILPKGGLEAGASIHGQKFTYNAEH